MRMHYFIHFTVFFCVFLSVTSAKAQQFQVKKEVDRVDLLQNGQLVTSYLFRSGSKPILWPLLGSDQSRMSREYPMVSDSPNEDHDHPHHRSLWMTFGDVNKIDFWAEGEGKGNVVHQAIVALDQSDDAASITAKHEWQTQDGKALLEETCKYTLCQGSGPETDRVIDCEYILKHAASADKGPIHFGDTKEGMFAIRVPEAMRADKAGGRILNSNGKLNVETWGQSAKWVDYSGKATANADHESGVAILIHPQSFRSDGCWHVRTYGLFAHNPFGIKDFVEANPAASNREGGFLLQPAQSIHLCYRVILHQQQWTIDDGNKQYDAFASVKPRLN
jgi:hypothetical protein